MSPLKHLRVNANIYQVSFFTSLFLFQPKQLLTDFGYLAYLKRTLYSSTSRFDR